jgi:DNA-binding LytR/AlgR family response regulator
MNRFEYPKNTDIICLEADINYTIFHLVDGRKVLSSSTLKVHEAKQAHSHFLRINRHVLINPSFINQVVCQGSAKRIRLSNGKDYPVSRRRRAVLENVAV